ncbi:IQ domain-containing protein D [Elysia marginata]|uniref:Dynein regulatory complex protein 10 n=1 Tax=Elysia marginata TaxID=1093978 RepID=A0AAV4JD11_9GAST|nr:IQ domain-containing protein D [Elysia marginata]
MASHTYTETVAIEPTMHMKLSNPSNPHPPGGAKTNNSTLRLRNLKLDPTRALEPARKKLATIEAQRIMAVFEESIKRAEIVTALPYIMENIHRFRVSLGSELVDMLNQHSRIQQSYQEARGQLDHFLEKRAQLAKRIEMKNAAAAAAAAAAAREKEISEMDNIFDDYEDEDEEEEEEEEEEGEEVEGETGVKEDVQTMVADDNNASALAADTGLLPKSSTSVNNEDVTVNVGEMVKRHSSEGKLSGSSRASSQMSVYEPRIEEAMRNLGLVAQQVVGQIVVAVTVEVSLVEVVEVVVVVVVVVVVP